MVDAESVTARIERLGPLLGELEDIRAAGQESYAAELRTRLAAEHAIQLAIQICIDVGAHLIAERGLEAPSDYRSTTRWSGRRSSDSTTCAASPPSPANRSDEPPMRVRH